MNVVFDKINEILGVIKAVEGEGFRIILEKSYMNYEGWSYMADDLNVGADEHKELANYVEDQLLSLMMAGRHFLKRTI